MPKMLVKPTEPFMLLLDGGHMEACRPSVVRSQAYLNNFIGTGKVKVLVGDLPDEITDADFLKFYNDSMEDGKADEELAIDSFKAAIPDLVEERTVVLEEGSDKDE